MKQEIDQLNEQLATANTVVLEAAHIYADMQPGEEQKTAAILAAGISSGIKAETITTLLIDDYNVTKKILDPKKYLSWLENHGYKPDHIFMESDLVPDALELLAELKEVMPKRKLKASKVNEWQKGEGLGFWIPSGKVTLTKNDGSPACALLDAALCRRKVLLGDASVTILPEHYSPQQLATRAILHNLGNSPIIANVFFGPNGRRVA